MFQRLCKPSKTNSFFLFGPRGTGKSTLIKTHFLTPDTLYIDLLLSKTEKKYLKNPDLLLEEIKASPQIKRVMIDEIQKVPKLLDIVHKCIEEHKTIFILTGSSARKLKRVGVNLLAGRAFVYYLFPLSSLELSNSFALTDVLSWGALPKIFEYSSPADKILFLESYVQTYLKEEIIAEQLIRNIQGFRDFLDIAAQMNGKPINYSKIARECAVDSKTIQTYFQILEDTLIGFFLPAYHQSVRKAQLKQKKFYFFDLGVVRILEGSIESAPVAQTSAFGFYFEAFFINEVFRCNHYFQKRFKLSHYQTATGQEIDLILSKAKQTILVEIKSTLHIDPVEVKKFHNVSGGFKNAQKYFVSLDQETYEIEGIRCCHWQTFLQELFLGGAPP